MVTQNTPVPGPNNPAKTSRPTREEMAAMLKKVRDGIMNTPALDSSEDWTKTIEEIDALLERRRVGGYWKKTNVSHERIRKLAPVFYERVERGDSVLAIARENQCNRTTVRNWHKKEKKRREIEARQP